MRKETFANGERYHVYNRGTGRCDIFLDDEDRYKFLYNLEKYRLNDLHVPLVSLASFVLMNNHFHLAVQQLVDDGLSYFLNRVCLSYAMYFNKKYGRSGCLFSGRFQARHVDNDGYFLHLTRYIHRNPLEIIGDHPLEHYLWSSYRTYCGLDSSPLVTDRVAIETFKSGTEYRNFVYSWKSVEDQIIQDISIDDE